jgi:hypothetical protein
MQLTEGRQNPHEGRGKIRVSLPFSEVFKIILKTDIHGNTRDTNRALLVFVTSGREVLLKGKTQ